MKEFWVIAVMLMLIFIGCGDEGILSGGLPDYSLSKAAHESTYESAVTPHEPRGIAAPSADTGWTPETIDQWEQDELTGLKKQLDDGQLTQAKYAELVSQVHADAQHQRDRLLNINYHIYAGIADPIDGTKNLHGWEVDIIYGRTMTEDDFSISISGDWEIQDFSSTERDDGNFDVYFFIATKTHRGIIDWAGLVNSIGLAGN